MSDAIVRYVRLERLAPLAFAAVPAWLWTADGTRVLWANAVGAATLGAATPAALSGVSFGHAHPAAREIARLVGGLPASGTAQLARLRGLTPGLARPLTCQVARFALPDGGTGVLVAAAEPVQLNLPLAERVARMFAGQSGLAVYGQDGALLYADGEAAFAQASLDALGAEALRREALDTGHAVGQAAGGLLSLERLGGGDMVVLLAKWEASAAGRPVEPATATSSLREQVLGVLAEAEERLVARRHPLRFVWTIDAEGRFSIEAGEFTTLVGEPTAAVLGQRWDEAADTLGLDPEGRVAQAIASRDTWSGITAAWPAAGTDERLPVLLSGLPVLDRDRSFSGYRGFGVCREIDRIAAVIARRRALLEGPAPEPEPTAGEGASVETAAPASPSPDEGEPEHLDREKTRFEPPAFEPPILEPSPRDGRAQLTVVPTPKNVVPLRTAASAERRPALSPVERNAFQEIARALGARLETDDEPPEDESADPADKPPASADRPAAADIAAVAPAHAALQLLPELPSAVPLERAALDRLPMPVLLFRDGVVLFGNRALLEWTGHASLDALVAAGGLDALFADPGPVVRTEADGAARALMLRSTQGESTPVDARLTAVAENGASAMMLVLTRALSDAPLKEAERACRAADTTARELVSILDTATDGVLVVDGDGRVLSMNRSAEALFGYDIAQFEGRSFLGLFAPESQRAATDYLEGLTRRGVASLLNDGREVIGRVQQGGLIPLFMTMGRIAEEPAKFCAVFRDITQWKRAEEELVSARRQAEKASSAKSDFLAKISHEIRTPLNAIIGFSEVMMDERLGPIGNERYRGYAKDIHTSGEHMISLLNDLLDLSKIEAGKLDLTFTRVDLNDVMQQCVAIMQPQANRERIIIRTALGAGLPPVVADARSVRQIVLNLLSNSIKFTGAGGQVIVSTALTDEGEVAMRVRDTGIGMSDQDIETALEPFRQLPASAKLNTVGTGLGLPLTKALAEANRASFRIRSAVNAGTLVEVAFPPARILSE